MFQECRAGSLFHVLQSRRNPGTVRSFHGKAVSVREVRSKCSGKSLSQQQEALDLIFRASQQLSGTSRRLNVSLKCKTVKYVSVTCDCGRLVFSHEAVSLKRQQPAPRAVETVSLPFSAFPVWSCCWHGDQIIKNMFNNQKGGKVMMKKGIW